MRDKHTISSMRKNFFKNAIKKVKSIYDVDTFARIFLGIVVLVGIVMMAYLLLDEFGILEQFNSVDKITAILDKHKSVSMLIYIGIQFLQVTFIPLPAAVTTVAGSYLFGPWMTVLLSLIAIIPASLTAFMLGRWLGKPFVSWMIGKETMDKYLGKTEGKERTVFFTMFLLPLFPDDALCMIAGITRMSLKYFLITQLITRPIGVIATVFLMSGVIIPFDQWWGIALYILAFAGIVTAIVLSYKYSAQIENFVSKVINKILTFFHIKSDYQEKDKIKNLETSKEIDKEEKTKKDDSEEPS